MSNCVNVLIERLEKLYCEIMWNLLRSLYRGICILVLVLGQLVI